MSHVCVVGSGPAGLTLAEELSRSGKINKITILEAGGDGQPFPEMSDFVSIGSTNYKPVRQFMLGGHAHLWGGACPRLNPGDFSMKSQFGLYEDWPVSYTELEEYYLKAEEYLSVTPSAQDDYLHTNQLNPILSRAAKEERLGVLPYGNRRYFVDELLPKIKSSDVEVYTKSPVRNVNVKEDLIEVNYYNETGDLNKLEADCVVLACGGLSNARLLQMSNSGSFPLLGGPGDALGSFHMDHPRIQLTFIYEGELTENVLVKEGTLYDPEFASIRKTVSNGDPTISYAAAHGQNSGSTTVLLDDIQRVILEVESLESFELKIRNTVSYKSEIYLDIEVMEPPLKENKLTITTENLDVFGDPMLATDININQTRDAIYNSIISELSSLFRPLGYRFTKLNNTGYTGQHPSGSTRMSESADKGVVDKNLKVFGTKNLYVVGSSVFPTGGYANPTLTITALSIRLAEYLQRMYG